MYIFWIILAIAIWAGFWLWLVYWLLPWFGRQLDADQLSGSLWFFARVYCRIVHRIRWVGFDQLPPAARRGGKGPVVVVANHTAGIDPLIVQSGLRRHLRWLMWEANMHPALGWLWRHEGMIPVSYGASHDAVTARVAVRHLRSGGAIGIFPEGSIARPKEELRPFQPGIGLIAHMGRAPIVVLWIHDTPYTPTAWGSVVRTSHSVVEYVGTYRIEKGEDPAQVSERIRHMLADRSGWPLVDESLLVEDQDGASH